MPTSQSPSVPPKMPRATKVGVLTAAVESVLSYRSESWTLTEALTKRLYGLYTRLLRFALNITWRDKWTNEKLYQGLPKLSEKLRGRRIGLAGHLIGLLGTRKKQRMRLYCGNPSIATKP